MKTLLAISVAASLLSLAFAAEAAPASVAMSTPMFDWTGGYVGVEGGGAWGTSTHNFIYGGTPLTHGSMGISGGLVGGTLGYNWTTGNVLLGVEGDLSIASASGSTLGKPIPCGPGGGGPNLLCTSDLTWFGTVRGRLGYVTGKWMPYLTGGIAFGNVEACEGTTCKSDGHTGWTIGGGVEAKLTAKWSVKVEDLYTDLGSTSSYTYGPTHTEVTTANVVRAGLNYRF
jgi:outer membrane immunogenic protein